MKLLKKNKIKNNKLNTELKEMGVFSAVAGNQLPNQLQKRGLPALFHLRCPSQSHLVQRSARGRTRLTTVTSISCRSFQRQLLYLFLPGTFLSSLLLSSSTRRKFYPQRSSGQVVVTTGLVPSPPRYVPSSLSRIGFSIPTARRFSSNVANSRSRAFRYVIIFYARKSLRVCALGEN